MHVFTALATALGASVIAVAPAGPHPALADGDHGTYCSIDIREPQAMTCSSSPIVRSPLSAAQRFPGAAPMAASLLVGRLYDNASYDTAGGYLNVYAGADCSSSGSDIDAQISDLGVWKNRISSFQSFGKCAARLWSTTGFRGAAYPNASGLSVRSTNVGDMNDRAASVQFS